MCGWVYDSYSSSERNSSMQTPIFYEGSTSVELAPIPLSGDEYSIFVQFTASFLRALPFECKLVWSLLEQFAHLCLPN